MVPLLLSAKENSGRNLLYGIVSGFAFYAISLSWLYNAAGLFYLMLAFYLSLYWGVFLYLVFALPERGRIFTAASIWVLLEIIKAGFMTGFPWLLLGLSQWQNPFVLKIAGLSGIYGISFLVVLANLTIFYVFRKKYLVSFFVSVIIFTGVFFLPREIVYGRIKDADMLAVMLVQPNIDASMEENPYKTLEAVESITLENLWNNRPEIVVWPEGSFPENIDEYPDVLERLKLLTAEHGFGLLLGTFTGADDCIYNSALLIAGDSVQSYNKVHLVPYGEFVPGGKCGIIRNIYWKIEEYIPETKHGDAPALFTAGDIRIAPLICFENVFPDMSADCVKQGGELFIVITNDSWFGRSAGPYQHFAHNAIRAAETGRYFVQSALSGISGIVSPYGFVENYVAEREEKIFVEGVLSGAVPLVKGKTFYSQFGDMPLFILSVVFTGVIICRRKR